MGSGNHKITPFGMFLNKHKNDRRYNNFFH